MLKDGTVCEIAMNKFLAHHSIKFNETELRLGRNKGGSGSRLKGDTHFGQATLRRPSPRRPKRSRLKAGSTNQPLNIICKMKMKMKMKILAISLNTKDAN